MKITTGQLLSGSTERTEILNQIERYATPNESARRWARGAIRQGLPAERVLREFVLEVTSSELA